MIFIISMNLDNTNLLADMHLTGFEPIIAKNVQKINFKFTMISIFTTLYFYVKPTHLALILTLMLVKSLMIVITL